MMEIVFSNNIQNEIRKIISEIFSNSIKSWKNKAIKKVMKPMAYFWNDF